MLREVRQLAQGHTVSGWSKKSKPGLSDAGDQAHLSSPLVRPSSSLLKDEASGAGAGVA